MKLNRLLLALLSLTLLIAMVGCGAAYKPDYSRESYSRESIVEVELVKVEHPFLGGVVDRKILTTSQIVPFYEDVQASNSIGLRKVFTCFEFRVTTKDGKTRSYRTNGHIFSELKNDEFYEFNEQENIISKYWGTDAQCK